MRGRDNRLLFEHLLDLRSHAVEDSVEIDVHDGLFCPVRPSHPQRGDVHGNLRRCNPRSYSGAWRCLLSSPRTAPPPLARYSTGRGSTNVNASKDLHGLRYRTLAIGIFRAVRLHSVHFEGRVDSDAAELLSYSLQALLVDIREDYACNALSGECCLALSCRIGGMELLPFALASPIPLDPPVTKAIPESSRPAILAAGDKKVEPKLEQAICHVLLSGVCHKIKSGRSSCPVPCVGGNATPRN
jgi:hypothetical protein